MIAVRGFTGWAGILVLALVPQIVTAKPMADAFLDAEAIQMQWDARHLQLRNELAQIDPDSSEAAALYLRSLDAAFSDAGFSLDLTFRNWIEVNLSPGQAILYPEVLDFGRQMGFAELMGYLTQRGPEYRDALYATQVLSDKTIRLLDSGGEVRPPAADFPGDAE